MIPIERGARAMKEVLMNCQSVPSPDPKSLDFDVINWGAGSAAVVYTGSHDDCQEWIHNQAFAAGLEAMWQDIGTAPKDGTPVDLWAFWPEHGRYERLINCFWNSYADDWNIGVFYPHQYAFPPVINHWMPIPPAPAGEG